MAARLGDRSFLVAWKKMSLAYISIKAIPLPEVCQSSVIWDLLCTCRSYFCCSGSLVTLHLLVRGEVCKCGASKTEVSIITGKHPDSLDLLLFTRCTDILQLLIFCCPRQPPIMLFCCKANLPWKHFQPNSNCAFIRSSQRC